MVICMGKPDCILDLDFFLQFSNGKQTNGKNVARTVGKGWQTNVLKECSAHTIGETILLHLSWHVLVTVHDAIRHLIFWYNHGGSKEGKQLWKTAVFRQLVFFH